MAMQREPIHFAGGTLGDTRHACAFFHDAEEEYRVLLPFIKEGLDRGEKAFHVVDPKLRDEHVRRLGSAGIDVAEREKAGQFQLADWEAMYFREGGFDQDRMIALWKETLSAAGQDGFPLTRLVAHMEWALEERKGVNQLLEYEAKFNLIPLRGDAVICTYSLAKFNGGMIMDILRTHPMVILGGVLQVNPFYVPPQEFLRELREREARTGTS
jgi:hypothetical protein